MTQFFNKVLQIQCKYQKTCNCSRGLLRNMMIQSDLDKNLQGPMMYLCAQLLIMQELIDRHMGKLCVLWWYIIIFWKGTLGAQGPDCLLFATIGYALPNPQSRCTIVVQNFSLFLIWKEKICITMVLHVCSPLPLNINYFRNTSF